jgi:hypothetical protein
MSSNPARDGGIVANGSIGGSLSSSVKQIPPMLPLSCDHMNTPNRHTSPRTKITKKCETRVTLKDVITRLGFVNWADAVSGVGHP